MSSKLGRNGTGVLFATIGALSGSKRDLATGFGVLFAGMGVLRHRAGAMSTGFIIMFAIVGVCWVGALEMKSVVGLESARVGAVFCGGLVILQLHLMGYLIYQLSLPFPNTLFVFLRDQQSPSSS